GKLQTLSNSAAVGPAEDPVRHRPEREGVPQRDHGRELYVPDPGVRADGDAVLREAGDGPGVVRVLAPGADEVAGRPRDPTGEAAVSPTHEGRARPLCQGCIR